MEKSLEQIIEAFDMMWGNFPDPVRLIDRNFLVVAANEAYTSTGGQINIHCNAGDPAMHKGCRALESLKTGETKIMTSEMGGMNWDSYWVPVKGSSDYYVHFTWKTQEFFELLQKLAQENPQ